MEVKDTGVRTKFETGSQKEIVEGRGRFDLLPLEEVANLIDFYYNWTVPKNDPMVEDAKNISMFLYDIKLSLSTEDIEEKKVFIRRAIARFINYFLASTPIEIIPDLARLYEAGAKKYAERDWEKGRPQEVFINSALRHFFQYLNNETDEAHDIAVIWNLISCVHILDTMPEMAYTTKRK